METVTSAWLNPLAPGKSTFLRAGGKRFGMKISRESDSIGGSSCEKTRF